MIRATLASMAGLLLAVSWASADDPPGKPDPDVVNLLASYPKALREAILNVAEHPALVAKLDKRGPKEPLEPILAGQSKSVAQSATMLAKYPEVLKVLREDPAATEAMAKAYAVNKDKLLAALDKEAEAESKAADEWAKRIGQDADAIEQMTKAVQGYQQQLGNVSAEDAADYAGVSVDPTNINVTALPSAGFSTYVMNNADVYPALANTMVSQWLGSRNSWAYDRTFNNWWHRYEHHFHDEHFLRGDEHRADRLAETARYDKRFAKDDRRWDKFRDHRNEYTHLAKVDPPPKDHKREPGRKPNIRGGTEHKPVHRPEPGKHRNVRRAHHASEHHHVHHAAHAHHSAMHHGAHHSGRR